MTCICTRRTFRTQTRGGRVGANVALVDDYMLNDYQLMSLWGPSCRLTRGKARYLKTSTWPGVKLVQTVYV